MKFPNASTVRKVLRILLGALMIWAALGKLADPQGFLAAIYGYELPLHETILRSSAIALPWLELLCGLVLLVGFWNESSLAILIGLMAVFVVATGQAWFRGLDISCGCFGTSLEENSILGSVAFAFFRNIALCALVGYLWLSAVKTEASGAVGD